MTPLERYQADLQRPDFFHDAAQANAVKHLQRLYDDLVAADHAKPGLFGKLLGRKSGGPVKGLYFWGGVGRGKTYLVDTFFESLPFEQKVRTHFHRFMKRVHEELKTLKGEKNPLTIIGKRFADEARVICFDEFFVSDITDAMILATLLEELFKNGVIMGVSTKLFSVTKAFDTFVNGMAELISVPFILVCAWSLGSIVKGMGTSEFLIHIVEQYLTPGMVPALVFLFGALISFSTGSSWGVWSIMMPIAFPMAIAFDISIPFVVGAVIGGGLFGDQCSPISDTTVLSSTGASCNHIVHVMTQLPYGITVGISAFVGFLFGGLTGQYVLSIAVTAAILTVSLITLTQLTKRRYPEKVH